MPDLRNIVLPILESHRLPGLDAGPEVVYPHYNGYSLANVASSVCAWLGAEPFGSGPLADPILHAFGQTFQHVILLVVDGLGLGQLEAALQDEPQMVWGQALTDGLLAPLTSISPSTTAAALTTLWTGVPPAQHGVLGYEMWLKEYSMIINSILHTPIAFLGDVGGLQRAGFQPERFLPVPTIGPHLARNEVLSFAYHHQAIARSGLSTMFTPGVKNVPYKTLGEMTVNLTHNLEANADERTYSYIYWGELDELAHRYGPQDERVRLEFSHFSALCAQLVNRLRARRQSGNTLLLLTADHGQMHTPRFPYWELRFHPDLTGCLTMQPSGENRLPILFARSGREDRLRDYIETTWKGLFRLVPTEQAVSAGLFGSGEIYAKVLDRAGDWLVVPQENAYWWWAEKENFMLGRHGGLSRAEMIIPLLGMVV